MIYVKITNSLKHKVVNKHFLDKQEITLHISFKYQLPTVIIQSKYSTTIFNKNIDNIHIYARKKNHNLALKG